MMERGRDVPSSGGNFRRAMRSISARYTPLLLRCRPQRLV